MISMAMWIMNQWLHSLVFYNAQQKIQLEQLMLTSQDGCSCAFAGQSLRELVTHSLYGKYSPAQNYYFTKEINEILEEAISPAYVQFHEHNYLDDEEEYLKREYKQEEFPNKIAMLSEYYKFHRDIPAWNQVGVQKIMGRYYSKVKDVDYKRIKQVLKRQQNISLSTHKSFSSFGSDEDYTKKSRYSTMLGDLSKNEDSMVLLEMCDKIGKALKKVKNENNFGGCYYSGEKKFEEFLRKQKKRKENLTKNRQQKRRQDFGFKKIKFNPKLNTKNDQLGLREINFMSNHSLKGCYTKRKQESSNQKTTANETIQKEEKTRKRSRVKNAPNSIFSSRNSLSKKNINDNFFSENFKSKGSVTCSIKAILSNNENLKTINEIYKPSEKPNTTINKKTRQLSTRTIKFRSNSHHNLPTQTLQREGSRQMKNHPIKVNRSYSKKQGSVARVSVIDFESTQEKTDMRRQNSHRILRSSSVNKLGNNHRQRLPGAAKAVVELGMHKKKNTVIESMLEKKLAVFKRKQAVL